MKKNKFGIISEPDKLINYWKKEKVSIILVTISGILYNVGLLLGPIIQGWLLDSLIDKSSLKHIIMLAVLFIVSIAAVQAFRYVKRFYVRRFANDISADMRTVVYKNILSKNKTDLEKENLGSFMTKAISDVDACVEGMRKFTTEVFDTGVFIVAYIIYMLYLNVKITVLSCLFIPIAMIIAEKLKTVIYKYTSAYRKELSSYSQSTYEAVDGAMLFRLFGQEEDGAQRYNKSLDKLNKSAILADIWETSMQPIYNIISMAGVVIVILLGGKNVLDNVWSVGQFSSYLVLFTALAFKASKTAKLFNSVQKASVSWKRIKPFLVNQSKPNEENNCGDDVKNVNIEALKFAYDSSNNTSKEYIVNGINIDISKGQMIGITGPVACGKSTFGKMFLGNYDYEGHILVDGRELKCLNSLEKSKLISYVGHSPNLMTDTIYNNICLGDDGDIDKVLKIVCLDNEIKEMTDGINTIVGNSGVRLSGGQQARVALARCLYHNTPILVLDDSFSAVDMNTEKQIYDNIRTYYKDKIIILISHRLKFFDRLDNIIVMNYDKTYQYGTHQELLKDSQLYNQLFSLQQNEGAGKNEAK